MVNTYRSTLRNQIQYRFKFGENEMNKLIFGLMKCLPRRYGQAV